MGPVRNATPGPQQLRRRRPNGTEVGLQIQRRHEPNGRISPSLLFARGSDRFDRRSPWPFAPSLGSATAFIEFILDGLAFLKVVEAGLCHRRMVEEDLSLLCGDESETTIRDDFLDNTLRHCCHPHITRRDKTRRNASPDLPAQTKRKTGRPGNGCCHPGTEHHLRPVGYCTATPTSTEREACVWSEFLTAGRRIAVPPRRTGNLGQSPKESPGGEA